MKNKIIIFVSLVLMSITGQLSAATFDFTPYDSPANSLILRDASNTIVFESAIVNGSFYYDTDLGTSSGSINAPDAFAPTDIYLHDLQITETSYGSLFMSALLDGYGVTNINVAAELVIDFSTDLLSDTTLFTLSTLDTDRDGVAGIMINNPLGLDFNGLSLDINGSMSLLAAVENSPYPTYVPVPAAIWLFASGLISLIGFSRYRAK
jgi:hypothetical protein